MRSSERWARPAPGELDVAGIASRAVLFPSHSRVEHPHCARSARDRPRCATFGGVYSRVDAVRLAAIEAAEDDAVMNAAADFEARSMEGRAYEGAEDTETLLSDAHRRFGP